VIADRADIALIAAIAAEQAELPALTTGEADLDVEGGEALLTPVRFGVRILFDRRLR
jgi:hypothetical protein